MKLVIDNREPTELITALQSRIDNISLENLELGDIIIKNDNNEVVLLFERKSLADLISSIKDGRYKEQSFRLSHSELDNKYIYYIIEGNIISFLNKEQESTKKMLFSSILSLSYKKGFSILRTTGLPETAEFIIRFYEKIKIEESEKLEPQTSATVSTYSNVIKTSKKSNITTNNINEIMLTQIPGVSIHVAKTLMLKFKTIKDLTNALCEDNKCLSSIIIDYEGGKRKISKNVVETLIKFLVV
jgi:crossover junction endonuclease MUS81